MQFRRVLENTVLKCYLRLDRITLYSQLHPWVTDNGLFPMMDQNANCSIIEVTEDEVENCVRSIPKLDTLILVKVAPI